MGDFMFEGVHQNKNILNNKIVQDNMDNTLDKNSLLIEDTNKDLADDIFSSTEFSNPDKILRPGGIAPRSPITNYKELIKEVDETQSDKIKPKYFFIGLFVLILIFVSGGFYVYAKFFTKKNDSGEIFLDNKAQITDLVNQNATSTYSSQNLSQNVNQDNDGDGLSNQEEDLLKTDKDKVDTDDDGLSDKDEVKLYKSDPNNIDSDGDGYLDGEEVKNGYDPMGPGKLLNFDFLNIELENNTPEIDSTSIDPSNLDTSNWENISSYINSLKIDFFANPGFDFKYRNDLVVSTENKQIVISGQDFKVYFEIKDNKLELDLSDWIMTQQDLSISGNDSINISNFEARLITNNDANYQKIILIADKASVYIFKYSGDINSVDNINIFKSIASSFNIK